MEKCLHWKSVDQVEALKDGTHSYAGATACREARRRRAEGSSSKRSRLQLRLRCPPRSRYPALPLLVLLLLLRPPWLARAQARLSRILSRGFNRSQRSYRDLPPRLALPLSLSFCLVFSFSLSFFVVSSIWSHSFARANRSARAKHESGEMFRRNVSLLHFYVIFFSFFFVFFFRILPIAPAECESLKTQLQAEGNR